MAQHHRKRTSTALPQTTNSREKGTASGSAMVEGERREAALSPLLLLLLLLLLYFFKR